MKIRSAEAASTGSLLAAAMALKCGGGGGGGGDGDDGIEHIIPL